MSYRGEAVSPLAQLFTGHRRLSRIAGAVLLLGCLHGSAGAQVLFVDASIAVPGNGSSWATALDDLQSAFGLAHFNPAITEIWVAKGTYKPDAFSDSLATFTLQPGLAIYGGFAGGETSLAQRDPDQNPVILDGDLNGDDQPGFVNYADNSLHVVTAPVVDASAILDGVTVRGGSASPGAGILCLSANPTLRNLVLRENWALGVSNEGGGLFADLAGVTDFSVESSRFVANKATGGAGISFDNAGGVPISIKGCDFTGNEATGGAGIRIVSLPGVSLDVQDCRFEDNTATGGAGINIGVSQSSSIKVIDSHFEGNTATTGGGISIVSAQSSDVIIRGTAFVDNHGGGGGISLTSELGLTVEVDECRFEGNVANAGGGIAMSSEQTTLLEVTDTIFDSNQACAGGGIYSVSENGNEIHVERCRFENNVLSSNCGLGTGGGGIRTVLGSVDIRDSVFVDNHPGHLRGDQGSTIAVRSSTLMNNNLDAGVTLVGGGLIHFENSILWGGGANQVLGTGVVTAKHSDVRSVFGVVGGVGNLNSDPLFVSAATGDITLQPGSPCIDAGDPGVSPLPIGADLNQDSRLIDGDLNGSVVLDMGADEYSPIHLEVQGTPTAGSTLTIATTGQPGIGTLMFIGLPGEHFSFLAGTIFLDLSSPLLITLPWLPTPSSVPVVVPAGLPSGVFHLQQVGISGSAVVLSNYAVLEL